MIIEPSPEDVRKLSNMMGCGLHAAKRTMKRDACVRHVEQATTIEELKEVIILMLKREI